MIDWLMDPTGMGAYRKGLAANEAAKREELEAARGRAAGLGKSLPTLASLLPTRMPPTQILHHWGRVK